MYINIYIYNIYGYAAMQSQEDAAHELDTKTIGTLDK